MARVTGYFVYYQSGNEWADVSGGDFTTAIDTLQHMPLGQGSVNYPNTVGNVIRTSNGEVPIDSLQPGDLVQTLDNGL